MKTEIPWDLIISKLQQRIAVEEDRQLMKWLDDNRNKEVFDELQQVWEKVQNNASGYVPDSDHYWSELSKRMQVNKPTLLSKTVEIKHSVLVHFRRYAAVACIVLAAAFIGSFYMGIVIGRPELNEQVYSNLGGKSKASLPDGTEVWLHGNTTLAYSTNFDSKDRLVTIIGEAYFDVTHYSDRPFIVQTEGIKVVVHGTKFNVEALPDSKNIFVSLMEGSVSLETSTEKRFLFPGETATFNKVNRTLQIAKDDVHFQTSWANDKMIFSKKPLGYVAHFLSKWYNVEIILAPTLSDKYLYTFTLRDETLEEILRLMSRINPIEYYFDKEDHLHIIPEKTIK